MANKFKKDNFPGKKEGIEDVTEYGEFISSFNQWMTPDKIKKSAKHLEDVSAESSKKPLEDDEVKGINNFEKK